MTCQEAQWHARHPLLKGVTEGGHLGSEVAASFAPACGLIGSLLASDVVNLLTGIAAPATLGEALLVDLRTLQVERESVPHVAGCPVCSEHVPGD